MDIEGGVAVIDHSSASGNGTSGITSAADLTLESSVMRGNDQGLEVIGGSTVRISNSVVTQNTFGINNQASTVTRQNNTVSGNTTDLPGNALTPLGGV